MGQQGPAAAGGCLQCIATPALHIMPLCGCLQEVRLYVALCLCHILRLNAPDTPYTDDQLQVRI